MTDTSGVFCAYTKDAHPCGARRMKGKQYCFVHEPTISDEEKKLHAALLGRPVIFATEDVYVKIQSEQDVVNACEQLANMAMRGTVDYRLAQVAMNGAQVALRALEQQREAGAGDLGAPTPKGLTVYEEATDDTPTN